MKKKILILSTAYPLAGTTFNLITASMWLNKYKLRIDKNDSLDINIIVNAHANTFRLAQEIYF